MLSIENNFMSFVQFASGLSALTLGGSQPVAVVTKDSISRETKLKTLENRPEEEEGSPCAIDVEVKYQVVNRTHAGRRPTCCVRIWNLALRKPAQELQRRLYS